MNREALKSALPRGIGSGVLTWVFYALVFEMLIGHKPAKEAFFSRSNVIFLIPVCIVEVIAYSLSLSKKAE